MGRSARTYQPRPGAGPTDHQPCRGFPEDKPCPVTVPSTSIYCHACREARQQFIAAGIPLSGVLPIGIILEDFAAPVLVCRCGGDPTAPNHRFSLMHRAWEWKQSSPEGAFQVRRKFV